MSRWPMVPLGNLVSVQGGGTPSRSDKANWNGEIPWVSPKEMKRHRLADSQEHVSARVVQGGRLSLVPAGSLLVVVRGMILARAVPVALADVPLTINQDMKALECNGETEPEYLHSVLLSREQTLLGKVSTAAHGTRKLDTKELLGLPIPLPPLDEQRRIVDLLNRAAGIRRLREQALATARNTIPALFLQTFGDPATNGAWPTVLLGDLAQRGKGTIRTGPFGSQLRHSEFVDRGVPVLGIDNVVANEFRWGKERCLPPQKYHEFQRFRVYPGDLLITIMGTTGRVCVAPDDLPECMSTKHLCVITLDRSRVHPDYVWGAIRFDPQTTGRVKSVGHGAIMDGWNSTVVRQLPIPLPPLDLQRRFAARLADLRGIIAQQEAALAKARDLERALLARLLE